MNYYLWDCYGYTDDEDDRVYGQLYSDYDMWTDLYNNFGCSYLIQGVAFRNVVGTYAENTNDGIFGWYKKRTSFLKIEGYVESGSVRWNVYADTGGELESSISRIIYYAPNEEIYCNSASPIILTDYDLTFTGRYNCKCKI